MEIKTKNFGALQIEEEQLFIFDEGIPGFEDLKKYILIINEEDKPFAFLQSVDDGDICFTLINPMELLDNYTIDVNEELLNELGISENNLTVFSVVVISDKIENITANLKAPILINVDTLKGMQVIINEDKYEVKHNIYEHLIAFAQKDGELVC